MDKRRPIREIFRRLLPTVLLAGAGGWAAEEQTLPSGAPEDFFEERRDVRQSLEQGLHALRTGLPGLAVDILSPLLDASDSLDPEDRERVILGILDALLQADRTEEAILLLRQTGNRRDPSYRLRWAIAEFLRGNAFSSRQWIRRVQPDELSEDSVPWYHLVQALLADREGDPAAFSEAFQAARDATDSPFLRTTFESIRARLNILRGEADEESVMALKNQLDTAVAIPLRIRLAREYAVMLTGLGRTEDAVGFLEGFISETEASDAILANELLLPLAVFRGLSTPAGRETLWEIVANGTDPETLRVALSLILAGVDREEDGDTDTLAAIVEARPDHPIRDRLLFSQIELLAKEGDYSNALSLTEDLLEEYPGTSIAPSVRRARAFLSWRQDPPQYRTAATRLLDYASNLDEQRRAPLLQLAGDLYFENNDYSSAAAVYLQAWQIRPSPEVAFQYVTALLGENRVGDAALWVEEQLAADPDFPKEILFRIDWNLCRSLIRADQPEKALELVRKVLGNGTLEPATEGNFRWLESYTLSLLGRNEEALEAVDLLIATLSPPGTPESPEETDDREEDAPETETDEPSASEESPPAQERTEPPETADPPPPPSIDPTARRSILAQALLLKGEILFEIGDTEEGVAVMTRLREQFPSRRAAVLSYLFEARYFAGRDLSGEAQLRLVNLADRFPESDYAPIALYEAAIIAESRGTRESISESIRLLEDLVNQFPDHPMAIHARIKEGEILRSMGDFNSARLVFENTANRFFSHPLRYLAEIGAAESVLANPDASPEELFEAAALLEKVRTVPGIPTSIVVETQLKRAEALRRAGEKATARRTVWESIEPFLSDRDPEDASLAFWLSKSLLELSVWNNADGRPEEAARLLELVDTLDLPGKEIARAKLRVLESPNS